MVVLLEVLQVIGVIKFRRGLNGALILQEFKHASGIQLPEGHYETVAGYVIDRLGRLPRVGDQVEVAGHVLTVTVMDRLRIARIRVTPAGGQAGVD